MVFDKYLMFPGRNATLSLSILTTKNGGVSILDFKNTSRETYFKADHFRIFLNYEKGPCQYRK